jgi:hypothetical protein
MRILLAALLLALAAAPAVADPAAKPVPAATSTDPKTMVTDDCARARKAGKTCVLDMKGEEVGGATPTAGGSAISTRLFDAMASLIHIRRDFIPEIIKTAEDL